MALFPSRHFTNRYYPPTYFAKGGIQNIEEVLNSSSLAGWMINTALLVLERLPGLNYDQAEDLVDAHLVSVGGWVPDDVSDPTGPGHPADDSAPLDAANSIESAQLLMVRTARVTIPVSLTLTYTDQFTIGTSDSTVVAQLQDEIQEQITNVFSGANVRIDSFDWAESTSSVRSGGQLSAPDKVQIQADIAAGTKLVDPAAICTVSARSIHSLDGTWMATRVFSTSGVAVFVYVQKHTDGSYATLDGAASYHFVLSVHPETLRLQGSTKVIPV
jgi:hypothetical protein